ncbi:type 2 periplasmic-binding domain-containing protein [Pseudoalteromonas phenolica]|uniref:Solute-binding protein family 3/N-terminal domain-containing protein n=1 Tax=Pseudoalteromonas phenolica TaxID=161398 RepID=A0A0S2K7W7_9GAMM|nr:hypothetical protein [Pseudoalteromonas phenolica]ALO44406.1 hypothetical protein PP2015_3938 [Pseudoalteromonas phenolica]MBE0357418.1 hypothetical protein [Pseudoalteromonas phenolica O-BC30]TMO55934.1 hypothetical protein CWC21_08395 [Pseudoalteromonas phenolica]
MTRLLLLCFCLLWHSASSAEVDNSSITIAIQDDIKQLYFEFLGNRHILDINDYSSLKASRDVVEHALLVKAIRLGGFKLPINYIQVDHPPRRIKLMKQGVIHLSATPLWSNEIKQFEHKLHISSAVLEAGRAEAGLYTHSDNVDVLSVKQPAELVKLIAVSNQNWQHDWKILKQLNFNGMYHTGKYTTMLDMLYKKRADVMLGPFHNSDDLSFKHNGQTYLPIKNLKVIMPDSRHFPVARFTAQSQPLIKALEKGLSMLKEKGEIEKAYRQSGYVNDKVSSWQVINTQAQL